jgi:hypothetical protein
VTAVLAADYSLDAEGSLTPQIAEGVTASTRDIVSFLREVDASFGQATS